MNWWHRLFNSDRMEKELTAELQFHFDLQVAEKMRAGMTEQEARRASRLEFGEVEKVREDCRENRGTMWVSRAWQDLRYAIRTLGRDRTFTIVGVLILALGIGSNTIIFSTVDKVLLRSLPYRQAGKLFAIRSLSTGHGTEPMQVSAADFYDWRVQSRTFESLAAYSSWPMNLTNVEDPRRLEGELVSASLFSTLGVNAEIGRTFLADEDQERSPFVVVISHRLWRTLGQSPQILGRQVTLNGSQATVVGVMPPSFAFPSTDVDAWVPLSLSAQNRSNRDGRWLKVIGRLAPSADTRDANSEMDVISRRLAVSYPAADSGWSISLLSLQEEIVGKSRPILLTLQAAALLLLLIACANLANLLLARAAPRAREIAVRAALGASRLRIIRQLLMESLVLALFGGGAGLALAIEGVKLVRTLGEGFVPRATEIHLSGQIVLASVSASFVTALVFGLAPAMHVSRVDLATQINSGARGTVRNVERKKGLLVSIELGLAAALLIGAGLLGESLLRLVATPTGLQADHLLTLQLTLSKSRYPTNTAQIAFFQQLLERVETLPGIVGAGEISDTPLKGNNPTFELAFPGVTAHPSEPPMQAGLRVISADYLQTAGIPVLRGRGFIASDRAATPPIAIINQAMARRYWPGADPIGRKVRLKEDPQWLTVAGLIPDVKHMGLRENEGPVLYIPYAQKTQDWLAWTTLLVRTTGQPMNAVSEVRSAIREIDKAQPIAEISTLEEVLNRSTAIPRFSTAIVCLLSGFALLIAVVGVYGLLSYTLSNRMKELAIRMTMGASSSQILRLLLRQAMLRVVAGVAAGLLGAWWLARWTESLLFGVHPHDPAIFAGVAGLLILSSLAAVLIPGRRVTRIDPAAAMRVE